VLAGLQFAHAFGHAAGVSALFNRTQHLLQGALDLRQLRAVAFAAGAAFAVEPVCFLGVSAHRLGGHLRRHHPVLEPRKHTLLKVTPCDRTGVRAGAIGSTGRTGITVLAAQRAGASAKAAMDQPGKQRLRPAQAVQSVRLRLSYSLRDIDILFGNFALTRFYRLPEFIVDNPQFRNLGDDPLRFRIHARHPPSSARVFDVTLPVPDQPTDIELIVDEAGAALYVSADRRVIP